MRFGLCILMLWLLSGCGDNTHHRDQKTMTMHENDALYYTVRVGETPYSDSLKIDVNGVATFLSTNNFQPGAPPEIGSYALSLAEYVVEDIWRTLEEINFEEIDTSAAMPEEGEGTRVITLVQENKTAAKLVGQRDVAPAGFKELEEKLLPVVAEVRQHPVSALRMSVDFTKDEVRRGEPVRIVVVLSNPGKDPIVFANPIHVEALNIGFLELDGLRSDIPLLDLRDQHHFSEKLNQTHLTEFLPESYEEKEAMDLPPGVTVQLTLQITMNWPAGEYNVQLLYACQRDMIGEEQVFGGQIDSPLSTIKVLE